MKFIKLLVSIFLLMCVGVAYATTYKIAKGDCLEKIAKANNSTVRELLKLNKQIKNPNLIYVGHELELPVAHVEVAPEKSAASASIEVHPEIGIEDKIASAEIAEMHVASPEPSVPVAKVQHIAQPMATPVQKSGTTTLATFLKKNYPKEVATTLAEMVRNDRFEILTEANTPIRVYTTTQSGKDYTLLDRSLGEWAKLNPKPVEDGRYLFSEVIQSKSGPAHIYDGKNPNRIGVREAIAKLFPELPSRIQNGLLEHYRQAEFQPIVLRIRDEVPRMLVAEGVVYEHVLQAQLSDQPIPAKCFAVFDEESGTNYLLIREAKSGNWYGEIIPSGAETCGRNRAS